MSLKGKTLFISGASRGIGLAIALRAARDGANVALIAKTAEPHPNLEGTVYTAAAQIEAAGGRALPVVGDIRNYAGHGTPARCPSRNPDGPQRGGRGPPRPECN